MTSFLRVPLDVTDETILKRFFNDVVRKLDEVDNSNESANAAISAIDLSVSQVTNDLNSTSQIANNANRETKEVRYSTSYQALVNEFRDFNNDAWTFLKGKGQFSCLGSEMTNPPYAVTAGTTYIVYADNAITLGGGVATRVMIEETGVGLRVFYRTGDTFATALTNGWKEV